VAREHRHELLRLVIGGGRVDDQAERQFPSPTTFGESAMAATFSPLTGVPPTSPSAMLRTSVTLQRS